MRKETSLVTCPFGGKQVRCKFDCIKVIAQFGIMIEKKEPKQMEWLIVARFDQWLLIRIDLFARIVLLGNVAYFDCFKHFEQFITFHVEMDERLEQLHPAILTLVWARIEARKIGDYRFNVRLNGESLRRSVVQLVHQLLHILTN